MITKKQAYDLLRQIVTENPDNINPTGGGSCLYHQTRKGVTRRCLIGELGQRLGLPQLLATDTSVKYLAGKYGKWEGVFTDAARDLLVRAQRYADTGSVGTGYYMPSPARWGDLHLSKIR